MSKFIRFIGKAAINNKQVALYADGAAFTLKAESIAGNKVQHHFTTPEGRPASLWITPVQVTAEELEALESEWEAGTTGGSDARTVDRALKHLSAISESRYVD